MWNGLIGCFLQSLNLAGPAHDRLLKMIRHQWKVRQGFLSTLGGKGARGLHSIGVLVGAAFH